MAELNVTPLLDLAFVLLIIFIITTPLIENGVEVQLPPEKMTSPPQTLDPDSIRTVSIKADGQLYLEQNPVTLQGLEQQLGEFQKTHPDGGVVVRADKENRYQVVADVVSLLKRVGIQHMDLQTAEQ
jgi:biopolymer transport protein ExbD